MPCEYERSHLCYMMKAHDRALRHGTRILSLQMQLLDRAEVLLGIRWSEHKLREKFFPVEAHRSLFDNSSYKINNF